MYIEFNPNPYGLLANDCVVRAISFVTGYSWIKTYIELAIQGMMLGDMPSSNNTWGVYLSNKGYKKCLSPLEYPECYRVKDFCMDHPKGTYILATGSHVVAVKDGDYYDAWDSGNECITYFFRRT